MATYVNQDVINAFHNAALTLGLRNLWELLERSGLRLDELIQGRDLQYMGPDIEVLPNLSDSERALIRQRLPMEPTPAPNLSGTTTAELNLRAGPGTEHAILDVLPPGTAVDVVSEHGEWLDVTTQGKSGFVHRDFVRLPHHGPPAAAFRVPFDGSFPVTQPYGFDTSYPANSGWHFGIDFGCPIGTPILAAAAGVVVAAGANLPQGFPGVGNGNWGNYVQIDHRNGIHSGYAHLNAIEVGEGHEVQQGQRVGRSGDTGFTRGAHLHFQCIQGGNRINPSQFLA